MMRFNYFRNKVTVFTLLFCALLLGQVFACNTTGKRFNKRDRYYRRHNYHRYYGKRSVDDQLVKSTVAINTICGDALCNSALDYPGDAISNVVKQLRQIYKPDETTSHTEDIDSRVTNFLSEYLKPDESPIDSPDIVYEESKGCQAFGNVSFPREGYSNDDGEIYYVVNVPELQQKVNGFTCNKSKTECGGEVIELPSTYSRTCQQVYREEEFLVLPASDRSQYSVNDFRVRTFLVPDGCKCVLLHTGDYEFLKGTY